jgi:hypothetical protein
MSRRTSGGLFAAAILLAGGSGRLLARGDGTFGVTNPTTDLRVAGGSALAAGDFNKDGKPDLASVDNLINGHVFLQDPSDRTVWKELDLPQANGSFFLRAADLDGDGMEDLMGANPGTGVFFLRSRGDGTFAGTVWVTVSGGPRWIVLADFDRDGAIDLASADHAVLEITVFKGKGDGNFSETQRTGTNGQPHSLEPLDYDGDGKLDLAAGSDLLGVELMKGNGDGRFTLQRGPAVSGFCYRFVGTGDFNGDGWDDVASGCVIAISNGDGTFRSEAPPGGNEVPLTVADLNGDGLEDIAYLMSWGIAVQRGSKDDRFLPPLVIPAGIPSIPRPSNAPGLLAHDLDGDRHADLVASGIVSSTLGVLWGQAETFEAPVIDIGPAKAMAISDLDGDGSPDLLFPKVDRPKVDAHLLRRHRADLFRTVFTIDSGNFYTSLAASDLDGDGWLDLAGAGYTGGAVLVTILEAGGKVRSRWRMPSGNFPAAVGFGRLGSDDVIDILVPCSGPSHLAFFEGLGGGAFAQAKTFPSIARLKDVALSDLDGDGVLDAAVISTEAVGVHFGSAPAGLGQPVRVDRNEARRYFDLVVADVSEDGVPDLMTLEKTRGLLVFQGGGGRVFHLRDPVAVSAGEVISLAAGDLDGDGLTDATATTSKTSPDGVTPAPSLSVLLYHDAGFGLSAAYPLPFVPLGHQLADLDGDGALDVVVHDLKSALVLFGHAAPEERFRRGDADGDGAMEITDALVILARLFLGGGAPGCPDAADANDDGELDLSDPIAILSRLFLGGEVLPPPGAPDCGPDPTPDALPACPQRCA